MDLDNVEKIKWEYIGRYDRPKRKVYGVLRSIQCCPVCKGKELDLYKNKGRFKLTCPKCGYTKIDKKIIVEEQL